MVQLEPWTPLPLSLGSAGVPQAWEMAEMPLPPLEPLEPPGHKGGSDVALVGVGSWGEVRYLLWK